MGPCHEFLVLIVLHRKSFFKNTKWDLMSSLSKIHSSTSSFKHANSEGSGETARMRSSPEPSQVALYLVPLSSDLAQSIIPIQKLIADSLIR